MGRDEPERQRAESQWIVAARPLCHLQYPIAYLSRLQRFLPAARWKLYFNCTLRRPPRPFRCGGLANDTCLWGPRPLLRVGKRTAGTCVACSPDSDLEVSKGPLGNAFTVRIRTGSQNQTSFYPSVPQEISILVELILGHLRYLLTDVPPQPNSPPDNDFHPDRPAERALGPKRGAVPRFRFTE
ncbi:Regulator of rDNA transcription protein 15 [Capsicum baccatum]|uniref:Regulator of rDNA transcription protein 15 n=1 Tax=Capsicum baccatum TaxID=33114 RepID=A0A2G2V400_CAPBA|nr:Regulator of rDNA transcription protein 15 [Capsicum baccatum]